MDKAEALAYVSRLFDAAEAGAVLWGDALLIKRFISQCSRTGSKATQDGYRFEIREFTRWREFNHPNLHLREIILRSVRTGCLSCGNKSRTDS